MPLNWFQRILLRLRGFPVGDGRSVTVLTSSGVGVPALALQMEKQPNGAELLEDIGPANWIAERVRGWSAEKGLLVGCVIPEGFASYARVFHPAEQRLENGERHRVSWSTVASWNGKVVHPQAAFHRIANLDPMMYRRPSWGRAPFVGTLPEEECKPLVDLLSEFTSTPELCYFAVWEGYGGLDERLGKGVAKLESPHAGRKYYIFRGTLDGVLSFYKWSFFHRSPNIWWPEDRAWCVATEIDDLETYVGGSAACIERVLAHPELEALPIAIARGWTHTAIPSTCRG